MHWTGDTCAVASGTAQAVTGAGGKKWFLPTADHAFGQSSEKDAAEAAKRVMAATRLTAASVPS